MRNFKTVTKKEKQLDSVLCNKCGNDIKFAQEGYLEVDHKWGYFSDFDMSIHSWDLCQKCYKQFTASFVKPITTTGYMIA